MFSLSNECQEFTHTLILLITKLRLNLNLCYGVIRHFYELLIEASVGKQDVRLLR